MRIGPVLPDEIIEQSNVDITLARLRKIIATGAWETDAILGAIAMAARSLTGATGSAIAMPRDGEVVCVGRSGETAPELGARLKVDSGISGECLRTGTILRCDDASRDFNVDAEVCRRLGLQSIAVVPLRGQHGRVGVLEASSTQSYAFTADAMDILGRLAGLAEAAWARGPGIEVPSKPETMDEEQPLLTVAEEVSRPAVASNALTRQGEAFRTGLSKKPPTERKRHHGTIGGLAILALVLLSLWGWKVFYKASVASNSAQRSNPQAEPAEPPLVAAGVGLKGKPGAARPISRPNVVPAARAAKSTADIKLPNSVIRQPPPNRSNVSMESSGPIPGADDVPLIAASSAGSTDLGSALSAAPALPRLSKPISQGVAGGVLQHKVQPVYPAVARRMGLEGSVVLETMVTVQGQVEDLKLISGHPILAQAAMDAVRQWRYTPYLLNGKPVPKQTTITIRFMAP